MGFQHHAITGRRQEVRRELLRQYMRLQRDLMEADPAYETLRALHAADLSPMRDSLSDFLMAWLGGPRDWFVQRPGAKPLPAPSPFTANFVENVERLKLDVQRVVHIHGGVDSWAEVLKAAGR